MEGDRAPRPQPLSRRRPVRSRRRQRGSRRALRARRLDQRSHQRRAGHHQLRAARRVDRRPADGLGGDGGVLPSPSGRRRASPTSAAARGTRRGRSRPRSPNRSTSGRAKWPKWASYDTRMQMRVYLADFSARFHDVRGTDRHRRPLRSRRLQRVAALRPRSAARPARTASSIAASGTRRGSASRVSGRRSSRTSASAATTSTAGRAGRSRQCASCSRSPFSLLLSALTRAPITRAQRPRAC